MDFFSEIKKKNPKRPSEDLKNKQLFWTITLVGICQYSDVFMF